MIVMHFHPHSPHAPHGERERGVFEGTRVSSNQGTWGATPRTQTMVILIIIMIILIVIMVILIIISMELAIIITMDVYLVIYIAYCL